MQIKTFKPQDHKIKALIYGPSGAGKTVFTGTAEKAIYASAEGGLLSIADKNPQFTEIKSLKDLVDLYSYLSTEKHEYETLVIDSITEINEIIKMEIERKTGHTMQLQDWGELAKKLRDTFRKFRDLPMNVIFIAQEAYITDEDKIKKVVPSLNGKAATEIAYFMDIVGYINIEADGSRWIETASNKKLLTKDRTGLIGNDTPMNFVEWRKRASAIKTGDQKIKADYTAPAIASKAKPQITETPHLASLKQELVKRGAKDAKEALDLLNTLLEGRFKDLNFIEADASRILMQLLQLPKEKIEVKKTVKKTK